jgi:LPXTG-site transpeptidase (sortase) family protein
MARLGTALACLGLLLLGWGALWQLGLAPGSRVTLPAPVALERQRPVPGEPTPSPSVVTVAVHAEPTADPLPAAKLEAADAADRAQAQPRGANAVRLAIPAIKLDTPVQQGGIVEDASGEPAWQTLPFVAVHYGDLTSRIGTPGNAVIAGHVVTLNEGNVFRFLYQLDLDDRIEVWDEHDRLHTFRVVRVRLVPPSDISVMAPTPDETLTLITCGGTFDPIKREFSDRLIVVAKPL